MPTKDDGEPKSSLICRNVLFTGTTIAAASAVASFGQIHMAQAQQPAIVGKVVAWHALASLSDFFVKR